MSKTFKQFRDDQADLERIKRENPDYFKSSAPKESSRDRFRRERMNHRFSDSIGGHSANYKKPGF